MPQDVMIWDIKNGNTSHALKKSQLDLEERIVDWNEEGISTVFGGIIDLAIRELVRHISDGAYNRCDYMYAVQKRAGETVNAST